MLFVLLRTSNTGCQKKFSCLTRAAYVVVQSYIEDSDLCRVGTNQNSKNEVRIINFCFLICLEK